MPSLKKLPTSSEATCLPLIIKLATSVPKKSKKTGSSLGPGTLFRLNVIAAFPKYRAPFGKES